MDCSVNRVSSCCHDVTIYSLLIVHQKDIVLVSFSCYIGDMCGITWLVRFSFFQLLHVRQILHASVAGCFSFFQLLPEESVLDAAMN